MQAPTYDAVIDTPIGPVGIETDGQAVTGVAINADSADTRKPKTGPAATACADIQAFFDDPNHRPKVSIRLEGTAFQQRVWQALKKIPPGRVRTYGDIARDLGSSARAVGGACRANPCPILVPCHRVVAANGALGGFSGHSDGSWANIKRRLLAHEGIEL